MPPLASLAAISLVASPRCHWWPAPPHAARGDAGGGPAHLPHSLLSNPFLSPRCAAAACRQGDGKRSKKVEPGAGTALPGGTAAQGPAAEVCPVRAVVALCSAYPQPILSLPSAYPLILSHPARGDGGGGGDAAAGELGGESARRLAAPGGLRPPMPLQATEEEAQPARSLSSAYPQPTL